MNGHHNGCGRMNGGPGYGADFRAHHEGRGARHGFGGHMHAFVHGGGRARRGDVRIAILRLLEEAPMHGYQIIQELSSRSGGAWSPSAGSIYPTLQQLADEGLVVATETSGKRVFSLTDSGRTVVAESADQPAPWDEAAASDSGIVGLRESAGRLMPALLQIGRSGSPEHIAEAIEILNDARKKLYAILSEE